MWKFITRNRWAKPILFLLSLLILSVAFLPVGSSLGKERARPQAEEVTHTMLLPGEELVRVRYFFPEGYSSTLPDSIIVNSPHGERRFYQ